MPDALYENPGAPISERVRDLLGRMTLTEKVGQLNQRMYGWDAYRRTPGGHELTDAFRKEVERFDGMGALYGLFRADPWSGVDHSSGIGAADSAAVAARVQCWVRENTRLGIPVLLVEEVPHGHQALDGTVLPVNLAVGASFDPDAYARAAAFAAAELRARGGHVALVSGLDMLRDPRWGRAEETFGEDPYLAARLTEALVRGAQGEAGADGLFAPDRAAVVLKHFAGQGAGVGGRNNPETGIGARELHEIHLPAARAGVRAGAAGVMAAYSEYDGVPCAANRALLTGLLREHWGFRGVVMADGQALDRLERLAGDAAGAGALALSAGVDLSLWDDAFPRLEEAVRRGLVPEEAVDQAVARVLRLKFRLGLFDTEPEEVPPLPAADAGPRESLELARRSLTLLHNDGGVLPLAGSVRRVAVLGPLADGIVHQIGDYTAPQRPGHGVTVLAGIRAAAPAGTGVLYAPGCALTGDGLADEELARLREAVSLARDADVAVLALGGSSAREDDTEFESNGAAVVATEGPPAGMTCGEGVDLADLRLPAGQRALLEAVRATGTPVVVVLVQGRPHAVPEVAGPADAALCAWYPGPWGGAAVADVLFGNAAPQGRLPVSVPRTPEQLPVYYNGKDHPYGGYVDQSSGPLYPFGHGLSLADCTWGGPELSRAEVSVAELAGGCEVRCTVRLRNDGARPAHEVVQLYVRRVHAPVWPRTRELRAFRRVELAPGERAEVTLSLGAAELEFTTADLEQAVEAGPLEIGVGPSSADLRTVPLTITR
ncbi:glycoside hydrolase family 3 N-terminal domain-containing protein [Streptomyces pathocidini]|uniref:Glycoside hydrolase family 3 N-terminal domain-containing protein n=1 Tax=Streptomyces pathocidini TaxID=1650571 RepID=A0ABW7UUU0_9ACTN|nr:glycoside hydrolase family 3 N-terminal domain-containing protein [Streptomyces pathocidini]